MRAALVLAATALLAAAPAPAAGDGLPVGNVDVGAQGAVVPGAPDRIVALPLAGGSTLVARIERDGGRVQDTLRLDERLTVPGVALDGTADGRSADGRLAVLLRPRRSFPQRTTRLVLLEVRPLAVRRRITLRGDFSFDALSPDGARMYLVNYVDGRDPRRYVVRSFDLRRGRLERGAIVDARRPGEDMRGLPVTRATSIGGRWAYTLYDGGGEPFVHALDTVERRAICIDLPVVIPDARSPFDLRLRLEPGRLSVVDGDETLALVDTETLQASRPTAPVATARPPARTVSGAGTDWALTGALGAFAALAMMGLAGRTAARRRRRRP